MKRIACQIKVSLTIAALYAFNSIVAYEIDHLEPPFWWVNMEEEKLQLLVHGKNISFLQPQIEYENVKIMCVKGCENFIW